MDSKIISLYLEGSSMSEISRLFNRSLKYVKLRLLRNNVSIRNRSESQKLALKRNPNSHSWRRNDKFKSKPCENFKNIFRDEGIKFVEEFSDFERLFSIDVAIPEMKIGFEINGNQHYDNEWNLKKYYKDRTDYLESLGWKIYQVHYSVCFNREIVLDIYDKSKRDCNYEFDYNEYLKSKKLKKVKKCSCGVEIYRSSKMCRKCSRNHVGFLTRKVKDRPSIDILKKEVSEIGYVQVGRKYGVSDNAVRRWLKIEENI
jgi:very-short-patch-repair endonuclease